MGELRDKIMNQVEKIEKVAQDLHEIAGKLDERKGELHEAYLTLKAISDKVEEK